MTWDGSGNVTRTDGTRTGDSVWQDARDADVAIRAADADAHANDLAEALENCIARDGQNAPTANLPMVGHKHTGCGEAAAADEYLTAGQLYRQVYAFNLNPGSAPNNLRIAGQTNNIPYTNAAGQRHLIKALAANTGPMTLQVGDHSPAPLVRGDGSDFASGEIRRNDVISAVCNGSRFVSERAAPFAAQTAAIAEPGAIGSLGIAVIHAATSDFAVGQELTQANRDAVVADGIQNVLSTDIEGGTWKVLSRSVWASEYSYLTPQTDGPTLRTAVDFDDRYFLLVRIA